MSPCLRICICTYSAGTYAGNGRLAKIIPWRLQCNRCFVRDLYDVYTSSSLCVRRALLLSCLLTCRVAAAVGTVQVRSLIEPIRKIIARLRGHFVQGKAVDLSMSEQLLEVETLSASGEPCRMYIPCVPTLSFCLLTSHRSSYDKLIIAVGSTSSTHGVAGLEHCFQLKTIGDAQNIRRRVMGIVPTVSCSITELMFLPDNFEIASLPTTTPEERKRLLSFVICGGGPTGVETAAVIPLSFTL